MKKVNVDNVIRKLSDDQVSVHDVEYLEEIQLEYLFNLIKNDFPGGEFKFLDIGGGNGKFTDMLLEKFPKSTGTIIDNSEVLLNKNTTNERKRKILSSVKDLSQIFFEEKFDLININWVLHHLVGNSYKNTLNNINLTNQMVASLIAENGRISIFENNYNGQFYDDLPGYMIYRLSSSKMLAKIFSHIKYATDVASVGVSFHSKKKWGSIFKEHYELIKYSEWDKPGIFILVRDLLHIKSIKTSHFWLQPKQLK